MNKVVDILMKRDDMTKEDAEDMVRIVRDEINEALAMGDADLVEDIMSGDLSLEMDYVFDIL